MLRQWLLIFVTCVFSFIFLILIFNLRLDRVGRREDWVWKCPILFRKELGWSIPEKMVLGKALFLHCSICHRVYQHTSFMVCYETSALACCMQSISNLVFWFNIMVRVLYFLLLWLIDFFQYCRLISCVIILMFHTNIWSSVCIYFFVSHIVDFSCRLSVMFSKVLVERLHLQQQADWDKFPD